MSHVNETFTLTLDRQPCSFRSLRFVCALSVTLLFFVAFFFTVTRLRQTAATILPFIRKVFYNTKNNMSHKIVCLFDVDGTLTEPQQAMEPSIEQSIFDLAKKESFDLAVVGGSDIEKIKRQLGGNKIFQKYKYIFAENGLIGYKDGKQLASDTIQKFIGDDALQDFINFCLSYISELTLPFKRGTFVEFRTGMLNISPVGRNCSQKERLQFFEYDQEHQIREKFIQALKKKFPDLALTYSIGGQISFDVFPIGWDKTYCLRHIEEYDEIHFFGDKTREGGNDYEIYESDLTIGHRVTGPESLIKELKVLSAVLQDRRGEYA